MANDPHLRRRVTFRQRDLQRALAAAKAAGLEIARVEVDREGKIVIVAKGHDDVSPSLTPFDAWQAKHARAS